MRRQLGELRRQVLSIQVPLRQAPLTTCRQRRRRQVRLRQAMRHTYFCQVRR